MRAGILLLSSLLAAGMLQAEEDKIDENLLKLFQARVYRENSGGSLRTAFISRQITTRSRSIPWFSFFTVPSVQGRTTAGSSMVATKFQPKP